LNVSDEILSQREPAKLPQRRLSGILSRFEQLADAASNGASMNRVQHSTPNE